jgi:Mrp family chromosome partitioning ATPase
MDLIDYLRLFRRRWALILACTLVSGLAAWLTTPEQPRNDSVTYSATHQLLRDNQVIAPQALATIALFVKTGEVPARVAERLGYRGNPALLAADVVVESSETAGTLEITATGNSRSDAARRANAFGEETLAYLGEQAARQQQEQIERVNTDLATLEAELDALDDEIATAEASGASTSRLEAERDSKLRRYGAAIDQQQQVMDQPPPSAGYITLQPALPELASIEGGGFSAPRSRTARSALAAGIGLLLGLGVVLVIDRIDTRLHEVRAISEAFGLPVIAEVPLVGSRRRERVLTTSDPMSALAESFRTLRSSLLLSPVTRLGLDARKAPRVDEPEVILVTSPSPGDGKTTTVANLAIALAESGRTVLVLGCDFRRPEIHLFFDRPPSPGLADVLTKDAGDSLADVVVSTSHPGVFLAPSGGRLRHFGDVAVAGRDVVTEARSLADVVIVDTPPVLATNDASELIPACDAVVVVARIDKTTIDGARRTRFLLDRLSAPVAGVVAVGVPARDASYGDYSSYYTTPERPRRRRGRAGSADANLGAGRHDGERDTNGGQADPPVTEARPLHAADRRPDEQGDRADSQPEEIERTLDAVEEPEPGTRS